MLPSFSLTLPAHLRQPGLQTTDARGSLKQSVPLHHFISRSLPGIWGLVNLKIKDESLCRLASCVCLFGEELLCFGKLNGWDQVPKP